MDRDRGHLQVIPSPWGSGKVAFMFPKRSETRYYFIPFGNLVFNTVISRSSHPEDFEGLL
jgi:hypothetical protein